PQAGPVDARRRQHAVSRRFDRRRGVHAAIRPLRCVMAKDIPLLQRITVAAPCSADSDDLEGDERRRYCRQCKLHVYNFAAMTSEQVQELVQRHEGRLCGRLYRRADGTVLTQDCPVGIARIRRQVRRWVVRAAGVVLVLLGGAAVARGKLSREPGEPLAAHAPLATIDRWLNPNSGIQAVMGLIAIPSQPTPPPAPPAPAPSMP